MNTPTISVDDDDPGIQYGPPGAWATLDSSDPVVKANPLTKAVHDSITAGATFNYTFNGLSISVLGTFYSLRTSAPTSTYQIDGGPNITFTQPNVTQNEYSQLFYQSPNLTFGSHTLVVTYLGGDYFLFDYLQYVGVPSGSTTTSSSPTTTTLNSSVSTTSSPTSTGIPSATPTGAIVGGTLGGLAIIALVVIAAVIFCLRRRRRRNNESQTDATGRLPDMIHRAPTSGSGPAQNVHRSPSVHSVNVVLPWAEQSRYIDTSTSNNLSSGAGSSSVAPFSTSAMTTSAMTSSASTGGAHHSAKDSSPSKGSHGAVAARKNAPALTSAGATETEASHPDEALPMYQR